MTAALLVVTGVLVILATALFVVSSRRKDPAPALAAMTFMIVAAIPAIAYASLDN